MVLRALHLVLVLILLCCVCAAQSKIDQLEYAIYKDLLLHLDPDSTGPIAFKKSTTTNSEESGTFEYLAKKFSSLDRATVEDFNQRNREPLMLEDLFQMDRKIILLGDEVKEVLNYSKYPDEFVEGRAWKDFQRVYGTYSLRTLSRVGFNKKQDQALVLYGSQYGWTAGRGDYYLLRKTKSGWKVKKKMMAWIS